MDISIGLDMASARSQVQRILDNIEKVIVGKRREVELALIALIAQGHILIEDIPGVGKTTLAKSIARSFGCTFRRIQFTPDLLPTDITGVSIYNQKTGDFEFRPGPVMTQIVLADEINRTSPKTQSALLECMEERQVTVDGVTHLTPNPFLVMATLNPIEHEGIFPLPEAQLDRFLMRLSLGYASTEDEILIIERQSKVHPIEQLGPVASSSDLVRLQEAAKETYVDQNIKRYVVELVTASRSHPNVYLGASPRGSLALVRCGQAFAMLRGRDFVLPDDIKYLAEPTLAHRLILSTSAHAEAANARAIIAELLETVPVPGASPRR